MDDFKITFVDTGLETLPGERILRAKNFIPKEDKDFMVTYGDGVGAIDIKKLVAFHLRQKTIGTITGVHPRSKFGQVRVNAQSRVTKFVEKPSLKEWKILANSCLTLQDLSSLAATTTWTLIL